MSLLSIEELRTLGEQPQGVCVSIYMPTIKAGKVYAVKHDKVPNHASIAAVFRY